MEKGFKLALTMIYKCKLKPFKLNMNKQTEVCEFMQKFVSSCYIVLLVNIVLLLAFLVASPLHM